MREARQRTDGAWAAGITLESTRMEKACQKGTEVAEAYEIRFGGLKKLDCYLD